MLLALELTTFIRGAAYRAGSTAASPLFRFENPYSPSKHGRQQKAVYKSNLQTPIICSVPLFRRYLLFHPMLYLCVQSVRYNSYQNSLRKSLGICFFLVLSLRGKRYNPWQMAENISDREIILYFNLKFTALCLFPFAHVFDNFIHLSLYHIWLCVPTETISFWISYKSLFAN